MQSGRTRMRDFQRGLIDAGVPASVATDVSAMPPTSALFSAFLGFNPMESMIAPGTLETLSQHTQNIILGNQFFPHTIAPAVMLSLHIAFYLSAVISLIAAVASLLRGKRFVHGETE